MLLLDTAAVSPEPIVQFECIAVLIMKNTFTWAFTGLFRRINNMANFIGESQMSKKYICI